jgi:serine/threonine-protein kinase RsbT
LEGQLILDRKIAQGDFNSGGEVSSALKDLLRKLGISSDIIRRVSIVTYELEMNTIIHSYGGEIRVLVRPDLISVTAQDSGPGIEDLERAFQPGFSTASDDVREMGFGAGMGLNNIEHYSDQLEVDTEVGKGTKIAAAISLN